MKFKAEMQLFKKGFNTHIQHKTKPLHIVNI